MNEAAETPSSPRPPSPRPPSPGPPSPSLPSPTPENEQENQPLSPQSPGPRRTLDQHPSFAFRTTPETSNKETDALGLSPLDEEPTPPGLFTFQAPGQPQTSSSSKFSIIHRTDNSPYSIIMDCPYSELSYNELS